MYSSNLLWTHQKFALSTKSFHRRTSRASVLIVICPLIDQFTWRRLMKHGISIKDHQRGELQDVSVT